MGYTEVSDEEAEGYERLRIFREADAELRAYGVEAWSTSFSNDLWLRMASHHLL